MKTLITILGLFFAMYCHSQEVILKGDTVEVKTIYENGYYIQGTIYSNSRKAKRAKQRKIKDMVEQEKSIQFQINEYQKELDKSKDKTDKHKGTLSINYIKESDILEIGNILIVTNVSNGILKREVSNAVGDDYKVTVSKGVITIKGDGAESIEYEIKSI